jgi:hypothetical protein
MNLIPNNKPVAYRMPCCDSLNTLSPRFLAEIFNKTTPGGKFLTIDTSVFNLTTSADPGLPRDLVLDADGKERIRKYVPFPSFVNTIENYPYPYLIGGMCWEFPCAVPSDWEAQNLNKPNSPISVADMKASIDAVVLKKGVFNFVFHPHGWIKPEQVVEIIDHVVAKHGKKVKFLTFREANDRLEKTFGPLRRADGSDNGLRLLDVDNDGLMDASLPTHVRLWSEGAWKQVHAPFFAPRYAVFSKDGAASAVSRGAVWTFRNGRWSPDEKFNQPDDQAVVYRDLDGDGIAERILASETRPTILRQEGGRWMELAFSVPIPMTGPNRQDIGFRFVDLTADGFVDIVASNESDWSVWVFKNMAVGWEKISAGKRSDPGAIPMITRNGTSNGAWFHSRHLWVQNEDTAKMKDLVDRRSFDELLQKK